MFRFFLFFPEISKSLISTPVSSIFLPPLQVLPALGLVGLLSPAHLLAALAVGGIAVQWLLRLCPLSLLLDAQYDLACKFSRTFFWPSRELSACLFAPFSLISHLFISTITATD